MATVILEPCTYEVILRVFFPSELAKAIMKNHRWAFFEWNQKYYGFSAVAVVSGIISLIATRSEFIFQVVF